MTLLMLLIAFLTRWRKPCPKHVARTALATFGSLICSAEGIWRVLDTSNRRFRFQLELLLDDDIFHITVSPDVFVEREWFLQELAMQMLEANLRSPEGFFAIGRCEHGQGIALCAFFDVRRGNAADLESLCGRLMRRMKAATERWHRDGLITSGWCCKRCPRKS